MRAEDVTDTLDLALAIIDLQTKGEHQRHAHGMNIHAGAFDLHLGVVVKIERATSSRRGQIPQPLANLGRAQTGQNFGL